MTPGPEPREAIRQAIKNAIARGNVLDRDLIREARFRFILFCSGLTVFVQVRRTRSHITSPEDCAREYRLDILRLRRVPLNGVVARELWLLSPWGTWQYFRILDDRVIEIRADGTPMVTERAAFTKDPAPEPAPKTDSAPAPVPDSVPAPVLDPPPDSISALIPDPSSDSTPAPVLDSVLAPVLNPSPDSGTDSVPASEPAQVPDRAPALIPDSKPDSAPARASLPGLNPVDFSPSSEEGE